jgi:enolase-phosphatase E1
VTAGPAVDVLCSAMLLDIEGTVAPVAFVHEIMFPFARKRIPGYLNSNWSAPETRRALDLIAIDEGFASAADWFRDAGLKTDGEQRELVVNMTHALMDRDAKTTGLKFLQGLVWQSGFHSGELQAPLFADVLPMLRFWRGAGLDLYIFSSGSIAAQKLFFGHTTQGDLQDFFAGWFDTTSGSKRDPDSYSAIAAATGHPPEQICFASDVEGELDAAREAGMVTVLRAAADTSSSHPVVTSLEQIRVQRS